MSSKLLVIIATGENEKALTGLMYAIARFLRAVEVGLNKPWVKRR
jgi:hypothetical protein